VVPTVACIIILHHIVADY